MVKELIRCCIWASRYGKGTADYLNCPLNEKEYEDFYQFLLNAERNLQRTLKDIIFEGCMPIEVMAKRKRHIRFGPLKPVGLIDPKLERTLCCCPASPR